MNKHSIIKHMYTGIFLIEGSHINPNGDPDNEGAPRQDDETGFGLLSPQSTSRRTYDRVFAEHGDKPGFELQIQRGTTIENGILRGAKDAGVKAAAKLPSDKKLKVTEKVAKIFFDSRMGGAVLNVGKCPTEGLNGVVTMGWGMSVHPVRILESALTRACGTNEGQTKDREMGRRYVVAHGVYRQPFFVNPHHAEQNGATMEDLAIYLNALIGAYEYKRSVMSGMISVRGLWLFRHDSKFGNAPAHMLMDRVKCSSEKGELATSWDDYNLHFDAADLPSGITVFTLEDLLGGHEAILAKLTE